jgi:GT2 family glycosyltransferase
VQQARVAASVVYHHSDLRVLAATIAGVRAQVPPPHGVRVLLNDATPAETDAVRAVLGGLGDVDPRADNLGFAGGQNANAAALFAAGADAVLVLNPDVRLAPDCAATLAAFAAGRAVLAGPLLLGATRPDLEPDGRIDSAGIRWTATARHLDARQGEPAANAPARPARVDGLTGACLLVPRAAYDAVVAATGELFDEDFFAYREDAELGLRAAALGIESYVVPAALAWHARGSAGTTRSTSAFANSLGVQNRFLLAFKYGRHRPGNPAARVARDLLVVAAVLLRERSSLPGLRNAWRLRGRMREKRRALFGAA